VYGSEKTGDGKTKKGLNFQDDLSEIFIRSEKEKATYSKWQHVKNGRIKWQMAWNIVPHLVFESLMISG